MNDLLCYKHNGERKGEWVCKFCVTSYYRVDAVAIFYHNGGNLFGRHSLIMEDAGLLFVSHVQ